MMLKSGDVEKIQQLVGTMQREANQILESMIELSWRMRGGITYHDMFDMSSMERDKVKDFIEKHMESIKEHHYPIY